MTGGVMETIGEDMVPASALRALSVLEDAGYEAWIVGGWVRDALRGCPAHDVDIATSARWEMSASALRAAGIEVHETGTAHGTVTAVILRQPIEITTYRVEGAYSDSRHPDSVVFVTDIREDLARRDFTINAMAWNPAQGLVDPFGGREDLERGLVRAVGEPARRFAEDGLRILRAVRFAARFGFAVEMATQEALAASAPNLVHIARERIGQELTGILGSGRAAWALEAEAPVMRAALPALAALDEDAWDTAVRRLAAIEELGPEVPCMAVRWAALLADVGVPAAKRAVKGMARGADTVRAVSALLSRLERLFARIREAETWTCEDSWQTLRGMEEAVPGCGRVLVFDLIRLAEAELAAAGSEDPKADMALSRLRTDARRLVEEGAPLSVRELPVTGQEAIAAAGIEPGPAVGALLRHMLDEAIAGRVGTDKEDLLAWLSEPREIR